LVLGEQLRSLWLSEIVVMTDAVSHEEREKDETESSSVVVVAVAMVGVVDELSADEATEGADAILEWSDAGRPSSRGMETSNVSSGSSKNVAIVARVRHDWMGPCSIGD
jgi:hypothetical protein